MLVNGYPWEEAVVAGQLLGIKTALNEFVAYAGLANLEPGLLSEQSKLITLYALCGFANFSSVGILLLVLELWLLKEKMI